jgi:acyl carrier protein
VVGGVPAQVLGGDAPATTDELDLPELLQRVLGLDQKPAPSDGPDQIPEWDSLGALKILLAVERTYQITVREDQLKSAQSVARLMEIVASARAKA